MSTGSEPPATETTDWRVEPARTDDLPEVARLVNGAYRGEEARRGWSHEAELLSGQRTDAATLADELSGPNPTTLLILREVEAGPILACVLLEQVQGSHAVRRCYLGMLTVAPAFQARGLGRVMLEAAEDHARRAGAQVVVMTVIFLRDSLIAWYERRGYSRTGETKPFPYGDERFGRPRRDDLHFVVLEKAL